MRLIDKLVFQDLIGPFVNGMMMFLLLVFAAGSLFQATDWLVKGIAVWVVVKLVLFKLPSLVTQVLPMAMLLAGLLGVGRLSADHELVAIFAAGISFPRMARVVAIMGAAVSVAAFFWNDWVVPPSSTAFWATEQKYIENIVQSHKPLSFSIDDNSGGGVSEFINVAGGYDSATNTLRDVTIVKFNTDRADKARFGTVEVSIHCRQAQAMDKAGLNWIYRDGEIREAQVNKLSGRTEVVNIWEFQTL
ncbi:MAG TPA: LptF/LptG family permease, partial [Chthonomonadales bacterium]|nr:LptF/LptG family permease [Chthonomonadales bacterium]